MHEFGLHQEPLGYRKRQDRRPKLHVRELVGVQVVVRNQARHASVALEVLAKFHKVHHETRPGRQIASRISCIAAMCHKGFDRVLVCVREIDLGTFSFLFRRHLLWFENLFITSYIEVFTQKKLWSGFLSQTLCS